MGSLVDKKSDRMMVYSNLSTQRVRIIKTTQSGEVELEELKRKD